jgi:hypothetical protein
VAPIFEGSRIESVRYSIPGILVLYEEKLYTAHAVTKMSFGSGARRGSPEFQGAKIITGRADFSATPQEDYDVVSWG